MPPAQRKPPPAPPGGPRGDKTPLLAGRAERSDGAPSAAARKKHAGPTVVVSHEGGLDTVTFRTSNSACLATLFVVCTALAFCGGYYLREHQSTTAQRKVSAIESLLIERAEGGLLPIINATELLLMREFDDLSRIEEGTERCADGLLISGPYPSKMGTMTTLLLLLWSFLGVAVLSYAFMMAIEEITSQEVVQKIQVGQGRTRTLHTHLWNPTIANLSLMALGSSAPEILLSVIEICGNGFYAGELGPSTIVGSAAFNMLVISGVCVLAIPNGEGRLIKELCVFFITAT
jgi:Ca2+/Na+ antiporter